MVLSYILVILFGSCSLLSTYFMSELVIIFIINEIFHYFVLNLHFRGLHSYIPSHEPMFSSVLPQVDSI